jgi:putative methionine-R-sulfoxide reductase with GAF domain
MSEPPVHAIAVALDTSEMREVRARNAAEVIRSAGDYRWVGIYDVGDEEIDLIGHTGVQAPALVRFSATQGLSGEAVRTRETVISNDVASDKRYLSTLTSTGSEAIVPILGAESGIVIGTLDVESSRTDAFGQTDRLLLEACAQALIPLFE